MAGDGFRDLDLGQFFNRAVNRRIVHVDDLITFLAVGFLDRVLDRLDRLFLGQDAGDMEEGGLHDHVDASAKSDGLAELDRIDDPEFGLFVDQLLLDCGRQFLPDLRLGEGGGQQKGAAVFEVGHHVVFIKEGEVVAGDEVCLVDQVWGHNLIFPEAQMACGDGA